VARHVRRGAGQGDRDRLPRPVRGQVEPLLGQFGQVLGVHGALRAAFCVDAGEDTSIAAIDAGSWADTRFADKHFTFRETPDGIPVSLAGSTSMVGGMVRVDPLHTPGHLRGRGYAGAETAEVSGAALTAGATDVVLFADPADATGNALHQRLGYVHVADFTGYEFSYGASGAGQAGT